MIPRILIDVAEIPGGGQLRLFRRGEDYSIMLGSTELMNSRSGGSEQALAALALKHVRADRPRVLIGGLGMGFTLRAALDQAGEGAAIVVAELVPAVIGWAKGPLAHLLADLVSDRRVTLVEGDVAELIAGARRDYDAILLDVDNGPDGLTVEANDRIYDAAGLARARAALAPGGVLAVWSSAPDPAFTRRLRSSGFEVQESVVRARGRRGARDTIWIGINPPRLKRGE
jgi:spermidine synthase